MCVGVVCVHRPLCLCTDVCLGLCVQESASVRVCVWICVHVKVSVCASVCPMCMAVCCATAWICVGHGLGVSVCLLACVSRAGQRREAGRRQAWSQVSLSGSRSILPLLSCQVVAKGQPERRSFLGPAMGHHAV